MTASVGVQAAGHSKSAAQTANVNGMPATIKVAQREIKVDSKTKRVNVQCGETVSFVTDQSSFAWTFDILRDYASFDLAEIAP